MAKKRLLIIGAGGFGREVAEYAMDVPPEARDWELGGFLANDPDALNGFGFQERVIGDPDTFAPGENDVFLCAIGDSAVRLRLSRGLEERGGRFITLVHPAAGLRRHVDVGAGCILCPYSGISTNVRLGSHVVVNAYSTIAHDVTLGDGCTLSSHCDVTGGAILEEGVFLGSHAVVLSEVRVGAWAFVGAGSVVTKAVPPGSSVFGVPARAYR